MQIQNTEDKLGVNITTYITDNEPILLNAEITLKLKEEDQTSDRLRRRGEGSDFRVNGRRDNSRDILLYRNTDILSKKLLESTFSEFWKVVRSS